MSSYSLRNTSLDPQEHTRTFLWDALLDETLIDRTEHDTRSLSLAYIVARDLMGFAEDEAAFQRYLNDVPEQETVINLPQTMHDRCILVYYFCWLIPMLDEPMRQGLQARYEADVKYNDEKLDFAIQLVKPIIVSFWRHKDLLSIERKCMQRVNAIVENVANMVSSDIDWNTMSNLGRERLLLQTHRVQVKLNRAKEWTQAVELDEGKTSARKTRRRTKSYRDDDSDASSSVGQSAMSGAEDERKVFTLPARVVRPSTNGDTPAAEAKYRNVKFSL